MILYQSGYLTIDKMIIEDDEIEYKLKLPNQEVKRSLNKFILSYLYNDNYPNEKIKPLRKALTNNDMQAFESTLKSIFASIPYSNFTNSSIQNYEDFYASVIYVYLQSLGIDIIGEDVTNRCRIDLTLFVGNYIYIIEFKVDSKDNALEQIKTKNYAQKYTHQDEVKYLLAYF